MILIISLNLENVKIKISKVRDFVILYNIGLLNMYNSAEIAKRIKTIAKIRQLSIKEVLVNAGLGLNTMANMKSSMPKADNLAHIADCLNVSTDYLLGRSNDPTDYSNSKVSTNTKEIPLALEPEEQYLIDVYRKADARGKRNILRQVHNEDQEAGPSASGTGYANIVS